MKRSQAIVNVISGCLFVASAALAWYAHAELEAAREARREIEMVRAAT